MSKDNERYLAAAVRYFIVANQPEVAKLLATCELEYYQDDDETLVVTLAGDPQLVMEVNKDRYADTQTGITLELQAAFEAVFPWADEVKVRVGTGVPQLDPDWRIKVIAELDGEQVSNQNPWVKAPTVWHGIRFDSGAPGEVAIAKALEKAGVMYLPGAMIRVGLPNNQQTFFPDFLICYNGMWGILEVDGQKFHTGTATQDYDRMRKLLSTPGISFFDRYTAKKCIEAPDTVVREFLQALGSRRG